MHQLGVGYYISGITGILYKTSDGGINWNKINLNTSMNIDAIYFINKDTGYATATPSNLKTTDSGNTWKETTDFITSSTNSYFIDNKNAISLMCYQWYDGEFPSCDMGLFFSKDGGITINKVYNFKRNYPNMLSFPEKLYGFAIGFNVIYSIEIKL